MKCGPGLVGVLLASALALPACGDNSVVGGGGVDVPDAGVDVGDDLAADLGALDVGAPDAGPRDAGDAAEAGDAGDAPDGGVGLCRDNADCGGNEFGFRVCDAATGACVACTAASRGSCAAGQYCTAANRCEAGCAVDADCAADGGTFRCDPTGHVCVGCTRDDQCGAGTVCGAMATCVPGCNDRQACPAGEACCGSACRRVQLDVSHCGACGRECTARNGVAGCAAGQCVVAACATGFGECDGDAANGCEASLADDPTHCGGCATACAAGANATATCAAGRCGLRCAAGYADCDGDASDGCEVDTRASVAHCGACGAACAAGPNSAASCAGGRCAVACNAGFGDCDDNPANGCEANTQTGAQHCGACGAACASGVCAGGRCGSFTTCQTIRETLPSSASGVYPIDPDGPGGAAAFDVYCDMTTDGGGWTLVAYASRGSVAALNSDTGIRNLYSLATGGGVYDGLGRRGVASLAAVPVARRSREMLLSRSDADFFTGPAAAYDVASKFTIPSPSTVNFLNANPAVALPERGACVPVLITTLRGPSATGAMRYVFQNTLSVSWTDTYPTSYGVIDTSNCVNGSLGPNFVSDYTGVGNLRSYPWPRAPDGAAHTYWHLGWWDATGTSRTGSVAIWLR